MINLDIKILSIINLFKIQKNKTGIKMLKYKNKFKNLKRLLKN